MAREGEGDKLEHIAEEEKLPAATVRQRVSRMRRWMRERWLAELAAAAAAALLIFVLYKLVIAPDPQVVQKEPTLPTTPAPGPGPAPIAPSPIERARELRRAALGTCATEPRGCLEQLDEARRLDPAGDATREVQDARRTAQEQLAPQKEQRKEQDSVADPDPSSSARIAPPAIKTPAPPTTSRPVAPPTSTVRPPTKQAPPKPAFDKAGKGESSMLDLDDPPSQSPAPAGTQAAPQPQLPAQRSSQLTPPSTGKPLSTNGESLSSLDGSTSSGSLTGSKEGKRKGQK